jgi:hypothetical protein
MKWLAVLALVAAFGLLGWGGSLYHLERAPVPPVEVELPERDLCEQPVGKLQVSFRVTNPSGHVTEVLGASELCGKDGCFKLLSNAPQAIPPAGSVDVVCELTVVREGPFEISGSLYLNNNGLRAVKLTLRGVGVAPSEAGDATPKK